MNLPLYKDFSHWNETAPAIKKGEDKFQPITDHADPEE
jgi:hypothetical protein